MGERYYVHIVDANCYRRARIARFLHEEYHAEIYESVAELTNRLPIQGALLINDDGDLIFGTTVLETVKIQTGHVPIALFSECPSPSKIVQAMLAGALDYLEWPFSPDDLKRAIIRLLAYGDQRYVAEQRSAEARRLVGHLTMRERDVLTRLVAGGSTKGIARELGISPRTVEIHRGNLMKKFNSRSTADAIRIGIYAELDR